MGKKSKSIKLPGEKYLVVHDPWGMRSPSTDRGKGCVNNLEGWFRIMLRDLVEEDHCTVAVYMVKTDHVIVEIPEGIDIQPLLGIHKWANMLTPRYAAHNDHKYTIIYEYNYAKFDHPKKKGWSEWFPGNFPLPPNFPIKSPYPPPTLHGAMPPHPSLGVLPLPTPPPPPQQPVPRTQTSLVRDPRSRSPADSLASEAEPSLPPRALPNNNPSHRDTAESATSGRASFDHLDAGRSDLRRTENSEEVRVKQEDPSDELYAAVKEYQARQEENSSTLSNHDRAPQSQPDVKEEELGNLVADFIARVEHEVKQKVPEDEEIKQEEQRERSTTAATIASERRGHSETTVSGQFMRLTEDRESNEVKREEHEHSWLKQEESLYERSTSAASVTHEHRGFKRKERYEETLSRQPKRLKQVEDPRQSKRTKSEPQ